MADDRQQRVAAIRERLRSDGRRWTVVKCALVEALIDSCGHLSARELHERLAGRYPQTDHSTVYRTLHALADAGVVHTLGRPGRVRYGLADRPHHHAICAQCDAVAEIPAGEVHGLLDATETRTGFCFSGQSLTLAGRCANCG
ncbi:transcriptional repressor [Actinoplanes bogorensis]|uniref:Transcriptional repressor n=1 Tax=Paractinoplanes bogorensis TaxID=1610840 RepID=A0ABS5YUJ2_9ACTN|nr:Fur family transcriptional regulator [Actinoplanes bogorensis]MBU2667124.1 transcriptional repressor [Actinoplanes bogorensis]